METINITTKSPQSDQPKVVVIGKFDGLHLGHQHLLATAQSLVTDEELAVYGFSDHPKWVLKEDEEYKASLTSYEDLKRLLTDFGVDRYYHVQFTKEYAKTSPQDFVNEHLRPLSITHLVVGEGFRFGKGRGSDADGLKELCEEIGISVTIVPHTKIHGEKISSTAIRTLVREGKMEAVQSMLGRPFEITGKVEKGEQLGRELGYPTLNLGQIEEYVEVKPAVYLGTVKLYPEAPDYYYTLISAGYRPAVNGDSYKVEAYIMDFSGDLYDQQVSVTFLRHLRDETDFQGLDALVEQMKQDEEYAREILGLA